MQYYGLSNTGKVRGNNEDFFHVPLKDGDVRLFVVADGMGGMNAGEVASSLAVADLVNFVEEHLKEADDPALLLRQAIGKANLCVYQTSRTDEEYASMGTTVVCALFIGNLVYVANVGDSRAYLLHDNALTQISVDHSYVQEMVDRGMLTVKEAQQHPNKNLITRAVGVDRFVKVDVFCRSWQKGDQLLLASDGLTGMVPEEIIQKILLSSHTVRKKTEALIRKANDLGGRDNITAILIAEDQELL